MHRFNFTPKYGGWPAGTSLEASRQIMTKASNPHVGMGVRQESPDMGVADDVGRQVTCSAAVSVAIWRRRTGR